MRYCRVSTAPLAFRLRGAGGGPVDNRAPQGSTYLRTISVQSTGASYLEVAWNRAQTFDLPITLTPAFTP